MTINWIPLALLAATAAGGVVIGLIFAPARKQRRTPTTYVVYRNWSDPNGHEILFESRSEKAAYEWYRANRNRYGHEAGALGIQARTALDAHNTAAMATPEFWSVIESLGTAWEQLQDANALIEGLQAELERRRVPDDPAFTVDIHPDAYDRRTIQDTAGLILEEVRRALGTPPPGIPNVMQAAAWLGQDEPGSVMPQFTQTEAFSLDEVREATNAIPPPPAGAPALVMKPVSKPGTQTVVIPLGKQ